MPKSKRSLQALYSPKRSPGLVRHIGEWERELEHEVVSAFREKAGLTEARLDELSGLDFFAEFGEGRKLYRIEADQGDAKAWPSDGAGRAYDLSPLDHIFLRANPEKIGQFIAEANGFALDPLPASGIHFYSMRRKVGAEVFVVVFCLNPSWFLKEESWDHLEKGLGAFSRLLFVVDEAATPFLRHARGRASPIVIPADALGSGFRIARGQFCHPKFKIAAADALRVFPEKEVVVDRPGTAIYLRDEKMFFQGANQAFEYMAGICRLREERVSAQVFCESYLFHPVTSDGPAKFVKAARKQVKTRLESFFSRDPKKLEWAKSLFLANEGGFVKRPFPLSAVLYWDDSLPENEP